MSNGKASHGEVLWVYEFNDEGKRERDDAKKPLSPVLKKTKAEEQAIVHTALQVAAYFLSLDEQETQRHEYIDPMKLQKLLYYAQGYSLALNNCPLFADNVVHYTYGPIVWDVLSCFQGERQNNSPRYSC